ncbi:hypothetical protein [Naasia lichenicola]|uniref:Pilus assembly protein n=1 Tax=Naasia lichenicola TaxID=2565933 RepID=A0A4S4FHD6_9MICO|nr:hypothetical protein [Naasia lichenicola]THG28535.1 hypothetical protein E6C64_17120 [Naasia lichenicola]
MEDGSASVEFVTAGVLLLVPFVYLVLALAAVQGAAFAVEGAARQAARVYVRTETPAAARDRADLAVRYALADFGVDEGTAEVQVSCTPDPATCLQRAGIVTIAVRATVPLPLLPPSMSSGLASSIPVEASASQRVSMLWVGP